MYKQYNPLFSILICSWLCLWGFGTPGDRADRPHVSHPGHPGRIASRNPHSGGSVWSEQSLFWNASSWDGKAFPAPLFSETRKTSDLHLLMPLFSGQSSNDCVRYCVPVCSGLPLSGLQPYNSPLWYISPPSCINAAVCFLAEFTSSITMVTFS